MAPSSAPDREAELVLRAASVRANGVAELLEAGLRWPRVIRLAERHRMLPLLARTLGAAGWQAVPPEVVESLRLYRARVTARNLFLTTELLALLELLGRAGVEAVPFKGPALAVSAYGDLALRSFGDLDILVAADDVARVKDLLLAQGFRSTTPRSDEHGVALHPLSYSFVVVGRGEVVVDVHWKVESWFPVSLGDVLPATRRISLARATVRDLSPEHSVLVQCVHGMKHHWSRLEWVAALAHTIERNPALNWDAVRRFAEGWRVLDPLALGLEVAGRLAGAPVPEELRGPPLVTRRLRGQAEGLCETIFGDEPTPRLARRLRMQVRNRALPARLRYVAELRRPNERDLAFVHLPPGLSALYYAVRPVRLAFEHSPRPAVGRRLDEERRRRATAAVAAELARREKAAPTVRGRENEVAAALAERWTRVRKRITKVHGLPEAPRVLEVGSGASGVVFGMAGGGDAGGAVGVDPLAHAYASLFPAWQRGLPTVGAPVERLPFRDGAFDLVLCVGVLDRSAHPDAVLSEILRVLRPGGAMYVSFDVHHPVYRAVAWARLMLCAAGVRLAARRPGGRPFCFSSRQAHRLLEGRPLRELQVKVGVDEAKDRARARRPRRVRDVVGLVLFRGARMTVVAERVA